MMHFHIVTLFKEACEAYTNASILGRAQEGKKIKVAYYNPRDFSKSRHQKVDDSPYGGGPGMVMQVEPILRAVEKALGKRKIWGSQTLPKTLPKEMNTKDSKTGKAGSGNSKSFGSGKGKVKILIMSPRGKVFDQAYAKKLAKQYDEVVLIAGRYEGIDARVKKLLKAEEVSTGPYVLTGGELPALTIVDAVSRHIEGVLGKSESIEESRIASGEMYTRPESFEWKGKNYRVPKVLQSGDHKKIDIWRATRK